MLPDVSILLSSQYKKRCTFLRGGAEVHTWQHIPVVLVRKAQRYEKKCPTFKFVTVFVLGNPTHSGLETAVCPIFAKLVLDIFALCSLVPKIDLSHTQQSYLCPKNQNHLLGKGDLKLSYFLCSR